jgi:hypothetical protein
VSQEKPGSKNKSRPIYPLIHPSPLLYAKMTRRNEKLYGPDLSRPIYPLIHPLMLKLIEAFSLREFPSITYYDSMPAHPALEARPPGLTRSPPSIAISQIDVEFHELGKGMLFCV